MRVMWTGMRPSTGPRESLGEIPRNDLVELLTKVKHTAI
ncbi:hypothetical protein FQN60_016198, partial [Etheostoma spectabile]